MNSSLIVNCLSALMTNDGVHRQAGFMKIGEVLRAQGNSSFTLGFAYTHQGLCSLPATLTSLLGDHVVGVVMPQGLCTHDVPLPIMICSDLAVP